MITVSAEVEIPKGLDFDKVDEEMRKGLYDASKKMKVEMESFVDNWKNKPRITWKSKRGKDQFTIRIFPTGKNAKYWNFVSFGVAGREIRPVRAKNLVFPYRGPGVSYAPKTLPGGFRGGPGKKLGPVKTFKSVKWPGITPRRFEVQVIAEKGKEFDDIMDEALEKGLEAAARG